MVSLLTNRISAGFSFLHNLKKTHPIGIDLDEDTLKIVQLATDKSSVKLIAAGSKKLPGKITSGSAQWQRWAIDTLKGLTSNGHFKGRQITAAIPAGDVFIDHIRMPNLTDTAEGKKKKTNADDYQSRLFARIKNKLPYETEQTMIKYIPTEENNVMVIAAERKKIDRYLAIYERANLQIVSIAVWPVALTNAYVKFFGRRKTDLQTIVMLVDIEPGRTNVVICRHKNLLFAHSLSIGSNQFENSPPENQKQPDTQPDEIITRLSLELKGCVRQFSSMYKKAKIERLIFLSGRCVQTDIYAAIARQLGIPAQMGDCPAAVEKKNYKNGDGIERRNCKTNWTIAFGLSLS